MAKFYALIVSAKTVHQIIPSAANVHQEVGKSMEDVKLALTNSVTHAAKMPKFVRSAWMEARCLKMFAFHTIAKLKHSSREFNRHQILEIQNMVHLVR